jgi:MoxR-like ATPase
MRKKEPKFKEMGSYFKKTLSIARARKNILLVGPAGCGKTTLAREVANDMKLPFSFIQVSEGMSESHLAGKLVISDDGGMRYQGSDFVRTYENGGVFLLDEIDAGNANTLVFINAALSGNICSVPNRPEKTIAEKHPDFVCIAAANTFGNGADRQYVGRNQLDAATLDRFRIGTIYMDYDPKLEERIVEKDVLSWGRRIRSIINENKMRRIVSTRFLKDLTDMLGNEGFSTPADWFGTLSQDWTADEKAKGTISIGVQPC